jgi:type I restriction enzyme R subunit
MIMTSGLDKNDGELIKKAAGVSVTVFGILRGYLELPNLWQRPAELRKLENEIRDELEYSGVEAFRGCASHLTTELIDLARKREKEVVAGDA